MLGCVNLSKKRLIVIHECFWLTDKDLDCLTKDDILFFDDCLYSQYCFVKTYQKRLKEIGCLCVWGCSFGLLREHEKPMLCIKSSDIHCAVNNVLVRKTFTELYLPCKREEFESCYLGGFMSYVELLEVLELDKHYLAFHGFYHLALWKFGSTKSQLDFFRMDARFGLNQMHVKFKLNTDIFVYPYAYSPKLSETDFYLYELGFKYFFGGSPMLRRIPIENISNGSYEKE